MLTKTTIKIKPKHILLALFSFVFVSHLLFIINTKDQSRLANPKVFYALLEDDVLYENASIIYANAYRAGSKKPTVLYTNIFYGYMGANSRVVKKLKIYRLKNNSSLFRFTLPKADPESFKNFIEDLRRPLLIYTQAIAPSKEPSFESAFTSLEDKLRNNGKLDPKIKPLINKFNASFNSHYYYATSDILNDTFLKGQDHSHLFARIVKFKNLLSFILQHSPSQKLFDMQKELAPFIDQALKVQRAYLKARELLAPYIWHAFQEGGPSYPWFRKNYHHIFNFKFIPNTDAKIMLNKSAHLNEQKQSYLTFLLKIQLPVLAVLLMLVTFLGMKGHVSSE